MMRSRKMRLDMLLLWTVVVLFAGCDPMAISSEEQADRASRHYTAAMAELQAGHIDEAIKGFEEVVRAEPGNGNAHFQLAALLEDAKKDYLGAIVHYRLYLMIRPESDKATVASDRLKGCETRYAATVLEKAGTESRFAEEIEKLRKELAQRDTKEAKLAEALDGAKREIEVLKRDVDMKKKMLAGAAVLSDDAAATKPTRRSLRPTDAELLDDESDGDRVLKSSDIKNLRAMLDEDERTASAPRLKVRQEDVGADDASAAPSLATTGKVAAVANPFARKKENSSKRRQIPETYTVEEGDTLMRISAKFYGTNRRWRDIRDANKEIISSDGRVKMGQVIKLP